MTPYDSHGPGSEQRRSIRRSALIMGGIALAFYVGFILMTAMRAG